MPSSALEQAELQLLWSLDEGTEHARRGHAYVFAEPQRARWVSLEHSPSATPHMLELLARWQAAHPPSPAAKLRRMTQWADPAGRWRFHGDLGGVRELLGALPLVHELGDASPSSLPELPEAFVREPIGSLVRAQLGPLDWPPSFEAPQVCVGPLGLTSAREHAQLVVCAARPGSIHAGSGQTRTAAIWRSEDEGRSWAELGWALDPDHEQPRAWPPEQVERVRIDGADVVIEWDDPWIDWESGDQWLGVFVHADQRWRVSTRD